MVVNREDSARVTLGDRQYVRPMDVVKRTGLSKSFVMAALRCGALRGHRVGKAWVIDVAEVEQWIRHGGERNA